MLKEGQIKENEKNSIYINSVGLEEVAKSEIYGVPTYSLVE